MQKHGMCKHSKKHIVQHRNKKIRRKYRGWDGEITKEQWDLNVNEESENFYDI